MAIQNVCTKEMRLVLSSDAKPRLKWTSELHQRFVDAVNQLGGPEKATPKSLMRVMDIDGLTLYHLKSHLQKYRMGRSQQQHSYHQNTEEETGEKPRCDLTSCKTSLGENERIKESLQITQAFQMQMEVQRKLHEQIEVQRHLQLRIKAQGKYLQSVLRKAQDTLCSIGAEHAKAQLSELVSMVDSGCPSSSFSVLTQSESSMLASPESSWRKEETQPNEDDHNSKHAKGNSTLLPLMEMHPVESETRAKNELKHKFRLLDNIDLSSRPNMIDLNTKDDNFLI